MLSRNGRGMGYVCMCDGKWENTKTKQNRGIRLKKEGIWLVEVVSVSTGCDIHASHIRWGHHAYLKHICLWSVDCVCEKDREKTSAQDNVEKWWRWWWCSGLSFSSRGVVCACDVGDGGLHGGLQLNIWKAYANTVHTERKGELCG
jgi:hypothetical protein